MEGGGIVVAGAEEREELADFDEASWPCRMGRR